MKRIIKPLVLIVALFVSHIPAAAWGDTGHMVVGHIAFGRLNDTAAQRVDDLVRRLRFRNRTYNHTTVATYMDDLKSDPSNDALKPWHFIDLPFFDGIPERDIDMPAKTAVTQIEFCIEKLKSPTLNDQTKAKYLAYLFHLVGDIHQPLHGVERYSADFPNGDQGGNLFLITGQRRKLHSYWDAAGGLFGFSDVQRPLNSQGWNSIRNFSFAAMSEYPSSNPEWRDLDINHWAKESFDLAVADVYTGIEQHTTPDENYQKRAQADSRKRIAMAGYRLAELLNDTFPDE